MRCSKVLKYFSKLADGELAEQKVALVKSHLMACPSCMEQAREFEKLHQFLQVDANLAIDPYLAIRVRALAEGSRRRTRTRAAQKLLATTIILAGLVIGISMGKQLHKVLQSNQAATNEQMASRSIDENMFTPMPRGSLTASYFALTSARR